VSSWSRFAITIIARRSRREGRVPPPLPWRKPRTCGGTTTDPCSFSYFSVGRISNGSEDETDAGQNQQRIDDELELSIREPLEDTQSEPRAEQGSRNESERGPVMQPVTLVVIYLMRPSSSTAPPLEQARTIVRLLSALSVPEQPSAGVVADGG